MVFRTVYKYALIFLPFSHNLQFTRLKDMWTDRQTDKQTDRILIARPRLHFMQRGKNYCDNTVYSIWQRSFFQQSSIN